MMTTWKTTIYENGHKVMTIPEKDFSSEPVMEMHEL